jgi:organic radical activating enzyme
MCCDHCLRGDSEDRDIRLKYITKLFEKVNSIRTLTLTGGEPTLVPHIVQYVADEIERLHVEVEQIDIFINGSHIPLAFAVAATKLFYLSHPQEEEYTSSVIVSQDRWHDGLDWEQKERIMALGYRLQEDRKRDWQDLKSEGRAAGTSRYTVTPQQYEIEDNGVVVEGDVYLNVKGQITSNCDLSYESQEDNVVCHVNKLSIAELQRYNRRLERRRNE